MAARHAGWGPNDEPCDFCDIQASSLGLRGLRLGDKWQCLQLNECGSRWQLTCKAPAASLFKVKQRRNIALPGCWGGELQQADIHATQVDFKRQFKRAAGQRQQQVPAAQQQHHPPGKEEVGNHSWTLLHTMAAYYPMHPTPEVQQGMRRFIDQFAAVYPCRHCAEHLQAEMVEEPPQVQGRDQLSHWWCSMHNKVNEQLGKPHFDCGRVLERWRRSNASTLAQEDEG